MTSEWTPGPYRCRTSLRKRVPWLLIRLVPKGTADCANHQWYKSNDDEDHCYHCSVGIRRPSGFTHTEMPNPSAGRHHQQLLGAWIVDLLPRRLWRPGNLYGNRWLGYKLHFCSGPGEHWSVRTVEWSGREVARGGRPFEFHQGEAEGAKPWLQRWPEHDDDA